MSDDWGRIIERLAKFEAMPCLRASGPEPKKLRPKFKSRLAELERQLDRWRPYLPAQPPIKKRHVKTALKELGISPRAGSKRPGTPALWTGLWRAFIFDRDDYRCFFCKRSGKEGVVIKRKRYALRLQLDHKVPRSKGGADYDLDNIRTTCRFCNESRSRMDDDVFLKELESIATAVMVGRRLKLPG